MYSLSGLVDGNTIKTNENLLAFEGRRVIITILDDTIEMSNHSTQKILDSKRKNAARELAGMWKSHDFTGNVDDMVRSLRRGRQFDT